MPGDLVKPIPLRFRGLDADQHIMDGALLGRSIQGAARIYNSILLYLFQGQIPKRIVSPDIRIMVGPPQDGSLMYMIYVMMTHGEMALYPQLLWETADLAVPQFLRAIIASKVGRGVELEKALDVITAQAQAMTDQSRMITQQATAQQDLMKEFQEGHMTDKRMLFGVIERLTSTNGSALSEMSQPIGRTARSLTHFDGTAALESKIDEPVADALRSEEEVKVGDQTTYRGKIMGVDKTTGACRFEPEGEAKGLRGKITDPSLSAPGNIYTHALDTAVRVEVTAKPIFKADGEIKTIFISDAKEIR